MTETRMAVKKLTMPMPAFFWPLPAVCELSRRAREAVDESTMLDHVRSPPKEIDSMARGIAKRAAVRFDRAT